MNRHTFSSLGRANISSSPPSTFRPSTASSVVDKEELRLHKEVLDQVRYQPWPLTKKIRVYRQAVDYVSRHQSEIEQRLAQDKTLASRMRHLYLLFVRFLQLLWKLFKELLERLIPWQQRIKGLCRYFYSTHKYKITSFFLLQTLSPTSGQLCRLTLSSYDGSSG